MKIRLIKVIFTIFGLCLFAWRVSAEQEGITKLETMRLEKIPPRRVDAISGSEFALSTAGMSGEARQKAALEELAKGNVPEFLRNLKPVQLSYAPRQGKTITGVVWVTPDYLSIGSNEDFLRIPLTFPSAVEIANDFGCILPTRKIVDAVFKQSSCRLEPDPLPPGPKMRSSEYYLKHQQMIRAARERAGCALGELTSGPKKDIVLTNRLTEKSGRIAIYGWYRRNGERIQPLSSVHGALYADYSHGVRLVSQNMRIDGQQQSIIDALENPVLSPLLTYEGVMSKILRLIGLKK